MTELVSFQQRLTARLLTWSALSLLVGALLQMPANPFWRAFGQQAMGWGAIDGAIALFGRRGLNKKLVREYAVEKQAQDVRMLRRVLWVNAGLDVLYVEGGLNLMRTRGRSDARMRGHGAGVVVQGAFLLLFDLVHAVFAGRILRRDL